MYDDDGDDAEDDDEGVHVVWEYPKNEEKSDDAYVNNVTNGRLLISQNTPVTRIVHKSRHDFASFIFYTMILP